MGVGQSPHFGVCRSFTLTRFCAISAQFPLPNFAKTSARPEQAGDDQDESPARRSYAAVTEEGELRLVAEAAALATNPELSADQRQTRSLSAAASDPNWADQAEQNEPLDPNGNLDPIVESTSSSGMPATDATIQALLAQNAQLITSVTQLSTDNAALRTDFAAQQAEVDVLKNLVNSPSPSQDTPTKIAKFKDALKLDCEYSDEQVLKKFILWTNSVDDIMTAEAERMIAKHCRDQAALDKVKSYEPTDIQVRDRCDIILHAYRSTLDIREDLYKEIKQNKGKGMAGPTNLQMQAQFYLYKVMKGTVTNVNILAEINDCRSMGQPGYQAWYQAKI